MPLRYNSRIPMPCPGGTCPVKRIFAFAVFLLFLAGLALVNLASMKPASGALHESPPATAGAMLLSRVDVPHIPE